LHLVRIAQHYDGKIPALNEVRELVMRDWSTQKRKQINAAFYASMRKNYKVTVAKLKAENPALAQVSP